MSEIDRIRSAYDRRKKLGLDARYSLLEPANLYLFQRRERALLDLVRKQEASLASARVLDIGCGSGEVLGDLVRYGADPALLCGIDLLPERIESAKRRNPAIDFSVGNAEKLPHGDASFDLCLAFTLFSSVLDTDARKRMADEALRVLKPDGSLIVYDFVWNPLNRDVTGIGLREIQRLFPTCQLTARRVTLAPPLSRRLAAISFTLCRMLEAVPFLRSHYLVTVRK